MLLKNFQLAIRNLLRDKFYTILNITGLAIGLAAALLLFIWVNNEYSYDDFHQNDDRLYRINTDMSFGGERSEGPNTAFPLAEAAKGKIPEIQHISTDWAGWNIIYKVDDFLLESDHTHFVYPSYLEIFDFTFLAGDSKTALINPNSLVLTETMANQLFGSTDVLGKTVEVSDKITLAVTGIIKDFPKNSHLKIDALAPIDPNIEALMNENSRSWGSHNYKTYALLQPNTQRELVEKKLTSLLPIREDKLEAERTLLKLQLVKDIYLGSSNINVSSTEIGDIKTIQMIALIGLLILLIACINYINLTTARAAHKAKSIGVQKIIGASRYQLFRQHLIEAICVVLTAGVLAVALADLSLPAFENLVGNELSNRSILSWQTFPILTITIIGAILLSGIQPALQLTSFSPIDALKGSQFNGTGGKIGLRKILVIGQFTCSTALVICTLIMMQQMEFIKNSKLGYEKEHIFSFWQDRTKANLIKSDLSQSTGVEAVTLSNRNIADANAQYGGFTYEGMPEGLEPSIYNMVADSDFKDFFQLELTEGNWFRPEGNDTKSLIINEAAAKAMQMENPIGKWVDFWGRKGTIIGVVKDFHFRSLHHDIAPLIFEQNKDWYYNTYVKTTGAKAAAAISAAEKVYKKHHPNSVFKYEFIDESFDSLYKQETQMSQLFSVFALLTIFISCLGIFGLATYTAERRGKEIGIRKVLGASILNIVNLLSVDFLKLVFLSLIIATPFAWYFMSDWLNDFAFSINIGWGVFATTALLTIMIAYFTIGFQSLRAALVNPAKTLKSE